MRAGLLKDRVTIQEVTTAPDTWEDVVTVWGELKPLTVHERFAAQQQGKVSVDVDHRIRIRYRNDVNAQMRAVVGGRNFYIQAPLEVDRRRELHLLCSEEAMSLGQYALIHGTTATFRRIALGAVDLEAGTQATTPTDQTVHLINAKTEVDETADIDVDTRRFRLVAAEITGAGPDTEDQIIIGSSTFEIVTSIPIEKRGVVEYYDITIRRIA